MADKNVKQHPIESLEDLKWKMFYSAARNTLRSLKEMVLNPELDSEQRMTLLSSTDNHGRTVLHHAASNGKPDVVEWLLSDEKGGGRAAGFKSVLVRSKDGSNALHLAAELGWLECCKTILNGCRENERHAMLNAVNEFGCTVLHVAAGHSVPSIIRWILTDGVASGFDRKNISASTKAGLSALHLAVEENVFNVRALLSQCSNEERTKLFLCVDELGSTALHYAVRREGYDVIVELLQYPECSLMANRKDNSGMTALHRAIVGGFDDESRKGWYYFFGPIPSIINVLLGGQSKKGKSSKTKSKITTTTTAAAAEVSSTTRPAVVDPNIGLGLQ